METIEDLRWLLDDKDGGMLLKEAGKLQDDNDSKPEEVEKEKSWIEGKVREERGERERERERERGESENKKMSFSFRREPNIRYQKASNLETQEGSRKGLLHWKRVS